MWKLFYQGFAPQIFSNLKSKVFTGSIQNSILSLIITSLKHICLTIFLKWILTGFFEILPKLTSRLLKKPRLEESCL